MVRVGSLEKNLEFNCSMKFSILSWVYKSEMIIEEDMHLEVPAYCSILATRVVGSPRR